jgi:TP901 family phage tail tape measure protein
VNLNIALVMRLVDQVSGPARQVARAVGSIGDGWAQQGRAALDWNRQAAEAQEQRANALRMQAAETAALGFAVVQFMRPAVEFEDQMGRVGAVLGGTAADVARLAASARELGANTAWSAREVAQGQSELATAGFNANQVLAAMPGVLALASAGQTDVATAAAVAAGALAGFKLEAREAGRAGDVLMNAANASATNVSLLGETMKYVASDAARAGASLEQTAGMAALLAKNTITGSMAGTAMRAIFSRLQAPMGEGDNILRALGVTVLDSTGDMRDMVLVLKDLDRAMSRLGGGQQAGYLAGLVGQEAASQLGMLMDAAGSGELDQFIGKMGEAGSALRAAAQVENSTAGGLRQLSGAMEEFQIATGTALLPVLTELLKTATPIVAAMGEWASKNPELVVSIAQVAGGLMALKTAGLVTGFVVNTLTGSFLGLHRGAAGAAQAIGWVRTGLGLALTAVSGFGAGIAGQIALWGGWKATLAMIGPLLGALLVNPITWAVAAVAGAAFLIWRNWDTVGPVFARIWGGIVRVAQGAWTVIKALFMTFSPLGAIIRNWGPITAWFGGLWDGLTTGAGRVWTSIGAGVASAVAAIGPLMPDWLVTAWEGAGSFFSGLWADIAGGAGQMLAGLAPGAAKMWSVIERAATGEFNVWQAVADQLAGFSWSGLLPALDWGTLVRGIDWRVFVPVVGWPALMGELVWARLIPAINWRAWLPASWQALLPRWNWAAIVPELNLGRFIRMPGTAESAPTSSAGRAPAGRAPGPAGPLQRRAAGGAFGPGPLLVGEEGPELYFPDRGGFIAHHGQLRVLATLADRVREAPAIRLLPTGPAARMAAAGTGAPGGPVRCPSAGAGAPAPVTVAGNVIIQAAPGQDPEAIARAVLAQLDARARQARRAALHDLEDTADG